jgi:hypothetical protein
LMGNQIGVRIRQTSGFIKFREENCYVIGLGFS